VFLVNSRLSRFTAAPSSLRKESTRAPLLPKVRGQFAEFLNRGSLVHLRSFLLAYRCRCAVRAARLGCEAFLGGVGASDFCPVARTRPVRHALAVGICLNSALPHRNRACPFARLTFPTASPRDRVKRPGAGLSDLLAIAYDYDVLGLGPDSPWDD
jgi:hypothetical protein